MQPALSAQDVQAMLLGSPAPAPPVQGADEETNSSSSAPTLYGRCDGCNGITPALGSLRDVTNYWSKEHDMFLIEKVAKRLRRGAGKRTVMLCCACAADIDRLAKEGK